MEYLSHYGKFEISPGRNPYEIRTADEGWFLYASVVDLVQQKQLHMSQVYCHREAKVTYDPTSPGPLPRATGKYSRWWPVWDDFLVIDRELLRGIILRPYVVAVDTATAQAEYTFSESVEDLDFVASKDGLFTEVVFGKGPDPAKAETYEDLREAMLTWGPEGYVCPNVFFAAGFRRQALDADVIEKVDELALEADESPNRYFGSAIYFGGTPRTADPEDEGHYKDGFRWRLVVPLKQPPFLEQAFYTYAADPNGTWVRRPWTSGSLSEVDAQSAATTGKTYYIGVIGDCICVSEDRFEAGFAYYRASDMGQPLVDAGSIRLYNWPGQCALWLAPMAFVKTEEGNLSYCLRSAVYVGAYIRERIPDAHCYWYGFSPSALEVRSGELVWPEESPAWWPEHGSWPFIGLILDEEGIGIVPPPQWPPYGPPGRWPVYPPAGWPNSEQWPPDETPPAGVASTKYLHLTGGRVLFPNWSPDEKPAVITGWTWPDEAPDWWPPGVSWPPFGTPGEWPPDPPAGWDVEFGTWPPEYLCPPAWPVYSEAVIGQWLQWRIEVEPACWQPPGQMASFTTPFIEGVTIWQSPAITRNAVAYQEPAFVKSVSIAEAELGNDTSCNVEVELDNAPGTYHGYPSVSLREGALCRATVGSKLSDGGVQYLTASGLVLTEIDPSPTRTILRFADILGALELAVWDRGDINLRGWSPADAIMCVGNLYGIPEDRFDLEDLGEYLIGDWKWEGQTIRSIMSDIAKRGGRGASLWFDPIDFKIKTGCRYCRTKRTAGDFASHQDNGWNSSGCLAADEDRVPGGVDGTLRVDTSGDRASLFFAEQFSGRGSRLTGEFLDRVQVQGKGFDGYPVRLQAQDARSISGQNADGTDVSAEDFAERYIGWRKSKVVDIQDDLQRGIRSTAKLGESTWDLLGQSLIEEMDAFGQRGRQIPGVVTPLAPTMRVGYVVYVIGGEWSEADEKKFRVRGAKHEATGHSTFNLQEMIGRLD